MLLHTNINTDEEQKEILPIAKESFPYLCSTTRLDCNPDKSIPWHWHNMFEINYVVRGELSLQTPDATHIVTAGEIDFINNGVLHSCTAIGSTPCEYTTIQFDMHFLSGMYNSIYEEKYILPIMRSSALPFWHVKPDSMLHLQMVETVLRTVELSREEPFGYEFDLRSRLSDFWKMLMQDTEAVRSQASEIVRSNSADTERLKLMTQFIKDHCGEKLTLEGGGYQHPRVHTLLCPLYQHIPHCLSHTDPPVHGSRPFGRQCQEHHRDQRRVRFQFSQLFRQSLPGGHGLHPQGIPGQGCRRNTALVLLHPVQQNRASPAQIEWFDYRSGGFEKTFRLLCAAERSFVSLFTY